MNKINLYSPTFNINYKNKQNTHEVSKLSLNQYNNYDDLKYYTKPILFKSTNIQNLNKLPFRDSSLQMFNNIYQNYKTSLMETSIEDIENIVDNIEKNTNQPRKKILETMQQATQFANMRSLNIIANTLNHDNCYISQTRTNNIGLNSTLNYFFNQKQLNSVKGECEAIFLDNNQLEHLEELQKNNPKKIEEIVNNKNLKFFILSGFNDGINFLNRNESLQDTTIKLLNKTNIDTESIKRANSLGIQPITIKNINEPTIENIYKQLRPEQMTNKELEVLINATSTTLFSFKESQEKAKNSLVKYLDKKLDVYTPERLAQISKEIYTEINKIITSQGNSMDDVYYYTHNMQKSYAPINYQFQVVNNINKNKFINNLLDIDNTSINLDKKTLVILDDCSNTGDSLKKIEEKAYQYSKKHNKDFNIIFAPYILTEKAKTELNYHIETHGRTTKDKIIDLKKDQKNNIFNSIDCDESILCKALGECGYDNGYECTVLPYMSPDNNSEFAATIGLLHSIFYTNRKNDNQNHHIMRSIKTFAGDAERVINTFEQLLKAGKNDNK